MSGVLAVQRCVSQLNFLKQTVERFETFHAANYRKEIASFLDFFSQDDVLGVISRQLFNRMKVSPKDWHALSQSSGILQPLPEDPSSCFAFRLGTLRLIRIDKLDLRFFITHHFKGAHLNEMLMHWKRMFVHPFGADCAAIADGLIALLPEGQWVEFEPLVGSFLDGGFADVGFGARLWTDEDDERVEREAERDAGEPDASAASGAPSASLAESLEALEVAVRALGDGDLLFDIQALRLEARRHRPARERALARLAAVGEHAGLGSACAAVKALF